MSVKAYQSVKESGTPFFCFCCNQVCDKEEITNLSNAVQELKAEIAQLKTSLFKIQSQARLPDTASQCSKTKLCGCSYTQW